MKKMITGVIIGCLLVLIGSVVYSTYIIPHFNKFNSMKRNEKFYDTTYLVLQGGTKLYGDKGFDNPWLNYRLHSWDAGKNWYAVDYNFDTEEFKIIGEAEKIYPGLIAHLKSWDTLTKHVIKNGPIDFTKKEDVKVLEGAGFTITKN